MMGMSSTEWSAYMHDQLGVELSTETDLGDRRPRLEDLYGQHLPLLDGAQETVIALA